METAARDNKILTETMLDLKIRSMRHNLILSGIHEPTPEHPEIQIKDPIKGEVKLPPGSVNITAFRRVHRIGTASTRGSRPFVAKFEHLQQNEFVKGEGEELNPVRTSSVNPVPQDNRTNNKRERTSHK